LHSKSQHTTVEHSRKLFKHTYTSDLYGTGTHIPIGFFQQDLLWKSSNTHSHSCSLKASKHTRSIHRLAIGALAHHNGTSAHSPSLACHLPAPTIECLHPSGSQHTLLITTSSTPNNVQPLLVLWPHWQVHSKSLLYHHAITIKTSLFGLLHY
jgi:hypothetical protein